jgi:hypothetical protein
MSRGSVRSLEDSSPDLLARLLAAAYQLTRPESGEMDPDGENDDEEVEDGTDGSTAAVDPSYFRDESDSGRNRILSALIEQKGDAAYWAFVNISNEPVFVPSLRRFKQLARRMVEMNAEPLPWTPADVVKFEAKFSRPIRTGDELLQLACYIIEERNLSYRTEDFSARPVVASATDEYAVQNYLADHFRTVANGRYNPVLDAMISQGLLEAAPGRPHWKLTETGYQAVASVVPPPSAGTLERTMLDAIAGYNVRPGETVPVMGLQTNLLNNGMHPDDFNATLSAMFEQGWLEAGGRPGTVKVTDAGFAQM